MKVTRVMTVRSRSTIDDRHHGRRAMSGSRIDIRLGLAPRPRRAHPQPVAWRVGRVHQCVVHRVFLGKPIFDHAAARSSFRMSRAGRCLIEQHKPEARGTEGFLILPGSFWSFPAFPQLNIPPRSQEGLSIRASTNSSSASAVTLRTWEGWSPGPVPWHA